jgi:hypothetical protein
MVKNPYWLTMIIYIPSILNQLLPKALTPDIKSGFFPFNTDVFTDETFLFSATNDFPLQDNKNAENSGLSDSLTSNWNLDSSSHPSTAG